MDPETIYAQLKGLVDSAPDLANQAQGPQLPQETHRWLGRLNALVEEQGNLHDGIVLRSSISRLRSAMPQIRHARVDDIMAVLFRAFAQAELDAPSSATGSFIAVGSAFDALRALSEVMKEAATDLLIVDPYMAEDALTNVAILANEGVSIRLLSDEATVRPGLKPAAAAWCQQYGSKRPLEARLARERSLHDRLIFVDEAKVWVLTQSLKDLAKRSPASLTASDQETANLKLRAYADIWAGSAPI